MSPDVGTNVFLLALSAAAFAPPIVYVIWLRGIEKHHREPWRSIAYAFLWGAIGGVISALVLFQVLGEHPRALSTLGIAPILIGAVVVAPFVEEFTKAVGLLGIKDQHPESEDGFVYGAAAGFGFSATENVVYGLLALAEGGIALFVSTTVVRTVASSLLHGSATAIVAHALWRRRYHRQGSVLAAYALAVSLHSGFNLLASTFAWAALFAAVTLALTVFWWVRVRIRRLDAQEATSAATPPSASTDTSGAATPPGET